MCRLQLEPDWQTVKWRYMEYLQYLGLQPWYLKPSPQRISESASGTVTDVVFDPLPVITIPCMLAACPTACMQSRLVVARGLEPGPHCGSLVLQLQDAAGLTSVAGNSTCFGSICVFAHVVYESSSPALVC